MNILFVMLSFPGMGNSSFYVDLVKEFHEKGHHVFPVAPTLDNQKTHISVENGIQVLRINTLPLFTGNLIKKGIANILLSYQYKKGILKFYRSNHFDLIIVATPSVMFANVVQYLKAHFLAKAYLILRDIFPQNAVDLGFMKKDGILYSFFRKKEIKLYTVVDAIGCTSQGNIDYILQHNPLIKKEKLHILNNFSKIEERLPINEKLREEYGLFQKFIVVFGGNMGIPQQLTNIIKLAKSCEKYEDVIILIIGKGTQRDDFERMAISSEVINMVFIDFIPRQEYNDILSFCDIGLISLNERFTVPNTPYKLNDYFDAGIPVLASIDSATDLGSIITENKAGLFSLSSDPLNLFRQFEILYNNPILRKEMGRNGKAFFKKNMTTVVAYDIIMNEYNSI